MIKKNEAKACIHLDKRYTKSDSTHPVKIRITFRRQSKYYPTRMSLTQEQFDQQSSCDLLRSQKKIGTKEYNDLRIIKDQLEKFLQEYQRKINNLYQFSFEAFENDYVVHYLENDDVFKRFQNKIDALIQEEQIGTSITYKNSLVSLKKFTKSDKLPLTNVTYFFLKEYEKWMKDNGRKTTTVGFYMRNLRAIINAMSDIFDQLNYVYPFGIKGYLIPAPKGVKRSLDLDALVKIFKYKPTTTEFKYFNYWRFMLLCNGINPIDMFGLKFSNIEGEYINFIRQKTIKSNRSQTTIQIHINEIVEQIIKDAGNKSNLDSYIFPVFEKGMNMIDKKRIVANMVKSINKHMRLICKKLQISTDITTYVARHSFATMSINNEMSILELKEALGHSTILVTEGYVKSLAGDKRKYFSNQLVKSLK